MYLNERFLLIIMAQPSPMQSKTQILKSREILNAENVARMLGITVRSASNLLQRWANEGTVFRMAPGAYMSVFAEIDKDRLTIQSLVKCIGKNFLLVGPSSLKRVGWCESDTLHVAVPLRPSRMTPRIRDTVIYPVGAKTWLQLAKKALQMDLDKPPLLHPLSQMLWWMDKDCPIEMPSPDRINWKAIEAEPQVTEAMRQHWLDELDDSFDLELFYRMLHKDRLTGKIEGRAEPFANDWVETAESMSYST